MMCKLVAPIWVSELFFDDTGSGRDRFVNDGPCMAPWQLLVSIFSGIKLGNSRERRKEMKRNNRLTFVLAFVAAITVFFVSPAVAQEEPADNMQILLEKAKADKKFIVAANMDLTESEAKGFWPLYEEYQRDLTAINVRIAKLIESYAADYKANTLTDDKAKELTAELVAIGQAEGELPASFVPELSKVLPPIKVARYLQIENKIRAAIRYELAATIPVVP